MRFVREYEKAFAEYFGAAKAFAFWKGRVALYAILKALGVSCGDEVILPGYTCVMDVNPVKYLGATPVFVDIDPNTYNIDTSLLRRFITPRTKVIIAQHTYGYPVDMDAVMQIAGSNQITLIEDCCLSLGSRYKGKLLGTFGSAAYFSSQWNKTYTTGLGGMVVCNDEQLARQMSVICTKELIPVPQSKALLLAAQRAVYRAMVYPRTTMLIRNFFRWLIKKGVVIGSSSLEEKHSIDMPPDFFMGMSDSQAKSGLKQLTHLEKNIMHRKETTHLYEELLLGHNWPVMRIADYADPVFVRYPVRVKDKWKVVDDALKEGIELGTWFESPLHPKDTNIELYGYHIGLCPQAEKAAGEVVNLPLGLRVNRKTALRTVKFITRYEPVR